MEESPDTANKIINFFEEAEKSIEADAILSRVFVDKVSNDTIEEKVSAQMNSISTSIRGINPRFKEGSKNYDEIKAEVTKAMATYENALLELSEFFDIKIEQLILRKVELESKLISNLVNDEYFLEKIYKRKDQKDNDYVKKSMEEGLAEMFETLRKTKQENNPIDARDVQKLEDKQDVMNEIDEKNTKRVKEVEEKKDITKLNLAEIEKELSLIDGEIERLNNQKRNAIFDAMEVGDKTIVKNIKKAKVFSKITRFFASKFNTAKVIEDTVISPFNLRIESFINNELAEMKG